MTTVGGMQRCMRVHQSDGERLQLTLDAFPRVTQSDVMDLGLGLVGDKTKAQSTIKTAHDALPIRAKGTYSLSLVDLIVNCGVICEHEIYNDFEYHQDRP